MENGEKSFRTFEDLDVYRAAREFRRSMYRVQKRVPACEKFELGSQIRRAAVSLTNNIAEGHGRYYYLDQVRFTLQARGSLQELIDDLNVCVDEEYLPAQEVGALKAQAWQVYQLLNGYIRFLRNRKQDESGSLKEASQDYGLFAQSTNCDEDGGKGLPIQRFNDSTV